MASLGDIYAALPAYRAALHQERFEEGPYDTAAAAAFSASAPAEGISEAMPALISPLTNVHATGAGVRVRGGDIISDDYVIKVFVYSKLDLGEATPQLTRDFNGL